MSNSTMSTKTKNSFSFPRDLKTVPIIQTMILKNQIVELRREIIELKAEIYKLDTKLNDNNVSDDE